ncbi:unnamed protein product, partial [marine sediment metagenome]
PQIVICDIKMPVMDGITLLKEITARSFTCKVILLTGYAEFDYAQTAIKNDVVDYVLKPAKANEITSAIERAVERIRSRDESFSSRNIAVRKICDEVDHPAVRFVLKYMEDNIADDISLNRIATILGLSPIYLSHLFKKHTKCNYKDFRTKLRLETAKKYLADPRLNVSQTAYLVGYSNVNYFCKCFNKYTGLCPSIYRSRFSNRE